MREAARARERHWPMFQLFRSIEEHRDVPQTFGGEFPSEVFSANPQPRLQVGHLYAVPGPDAVEVNAILVQATVFNDKAQCILRDAASDRCWLGTFDMAPDELADYARHPDTYFGDHKGYRQKAESPMDLFDFFVHAHRNTPVGRLVELLSNYPDQQALPTMPHKDLVELVAEGYVMGAIAQGLFTEPRRNKGSRTPARETPPIG